MIGRRNLALLAPAALVIATELDGPSMAEVNAPPAVIDMIQDTTPVENAIAFRLFDELDVMEPDEDGDFGEHYRIAREWAEFFAG